MNTINEDQFDQMIELTSDQVRSVSGGATEDFILTLCGQEVFRIEFPSVDIKIDICNGDASVDISPKLD